MVAVKRRTNRHIGGDGGRAALIENQRRPPLHLAISRASFLCSLIIYLLRSLLSTRSRVHASVVHALQQ